MKTFSNTNPPTSAQEIYDAVKEHLLTQNVQCLNEVGNCAYRGDGGLKCAVGALIPDEDYIKDMESSGITRLIYLFPQCEWMAPYSQLLTHLQCVHDSNLPDNWEQELAGVARTYNLNP